MATQRSPPPRNPLRSFFGLRKTPSAATVPPTSPSRKTPINRNTPKCDLPTSWDEWNDLYVQGLVEFENPPNPPAPFAEAPAKSISELGFFKAPEHPHEQRRQRTASAFRLSQHKNLVGSHCYPLPGNNPAILEVHKPLAALTSKGQQRFGTNGVQCSILDEGMLYYLAEVGFGLGVLKRETTLCSHTMLKAQTGDISPFVVLDMESDWRFKNNNFAQYSSGFYAGASITIPSLYDPAVREPVGIFCLIDDTPRAAFSDSDRNDLQELARLAGIEIHRWLSLKESRRITELSAGKEDWDQSAGVAPVASRVAAPIDSSIEDRAQVTTSEPPTTRVRSSSAAGALGRRLTFATPRTIVLTDKTQSVLDLSTQLISESLELEFTYLARITPASSSETSISFSLSLLSSHNLPTPPPRFSIEKHLALLTSESPSLLYHAEDPTKVTSEEFVAGVLWRVDESHVLAGFSSDPRRVFSPADRAFLGRFAEDLRKWTSGGDGV